LDAWLNILTLGELWELAALGRNRLDSVQFPRRGTNQTLNAL